MTKAIRRKGLMAVDDRPYISPQVALVVKNTPANAGDIRDMGSVSGLGKSHGGGLGNPL